MKKTCVLIGMALICSPTFSSMAQPVVTVKTLLEEMTNVQVSARWPNPNFFAKQASSYDRRSVSPEKPGWFANNDFNQFIRKERKLQHVEYVMIDVDGPAAITRFWLTTLFKKGVLRFYFDNEKKPSLKIPAYDLMKGNLNLDATLLIPHSSYTPDGKGGNTLYLAFPYQRHCKITFEFIDSTTVNSPHYYQINYRTYPKGTRIETFTNGNLSKYKAAINEAEKLLKKPPLDESGEIISKKNFIKGNSKVSFELPKGSAAIHLMKLKIKTANKEELDKAFSSTIIKIEFDGKETVWCPLGDFIGSGYGKNEVKSWYRNLSNNGLLVSRWVMPYQKTAKISIINKADFSLNTDVEVTIHHWNWDDRSMYFHTSYRHEKNVKDVKGDYEVNKIALKDSAGPIDWNLITIKGKGIYMGNTLSINNHMHAWYGEGDAKVWVDNDKFPSEFGTGLEDYYNTSWAPVVLYQTPFANATRADNEDSYGYNTFTRTRNLDRIPFNDSFTYNLGMISWIGGTIDCAATVYWYGFLGADDNGRKK